MKRPRDEEEEFKGVEFLAESFDDYLDFCAYDGEKRIEFPFRSNICADCRAREDRDPCELCWNFYHFKKFAIKHYFSVPGIRHLRLGRPASKKKKRPFVLYRDGLFELHDFDGALLASFCQKKTRTDFELKPVHSIEVTRGDDPGFADKMKKYGWGNKIKM